MESVVSYFATLGLDFWGLAKVCALILLGSLLFTSLCRFIFGRKSLLGTSISSSIAIIFIYVISVLILTLASQWSWLVSPLPFAKISNEQIRFFTFQGADYTQVASELLSMVILSFLVNLADTWMPRGKNILSWVFWRCVTVIVGFGLHFLTTWLFHKYLPQGIVIYAPVILLAILAVMLLTGALKIPIGLMLTTVNPLIAALYTFFFANIVGKQVTKAVLTTAILTGVVFALQNLGVATLPLMAAALIAYVPFLLLLIIIWYTVNRLL